MTIARHGCFGIRPGDWINGSIDSTILGAPGDHLALDDGGEPVVAVGGVEVVRPGRRLIKVFMLGR
ncbi:hypothetical protein Axi01nite_44480 [Actinoplanes xinjiangensis]|nr:hypothetical protein Axi01nite_44480 [Actinoplanes xinjiangensis]